MNQNLTPETQATSPWSFLLNPTAAVPIETVYAPRKRGRPQRHVPSTGGKLSHRMDSGKPAYTKELTNSQRISLVKQFKNLFRDQQVPLKTAIEAIAKAFKITYVQACRHTQEHI